MGESAVSCLAVALNMQPPPSQGNDTSNLASMVDTNDGDIGAFYEIDYSVPPPPPSPALGAELDYPWSIFPATDDSIMKSKFAMPSKSQSAQLLLPQSACAAFSQMNRYEIATEKFDLMADMPRKERTTPSKRPRETTHGFTQLADPFPPLPHHDPNIASPLWKRPRIRRTPPDLTD